MQKSFAPVPEWESIDLATLRTDIIRSNKPAVLRRYAKHWPIVGVGETSPTAMINYLGERFKGENVEVFSAPKTIDGKFFYESGKTGYNFTKTQEHFHAFLRRLHTSIKDSDLSALYSGALRADVHFPKLLTDNHILAPAHKAVARLWIGNAVTVPTHYDLSENIACVLAGRRRFTFFPPEQIENLYIGPLENTLAGQPISMVDLNSPNMDKFPRFEAALKTAQTAVLAPGDAVFIPYHWWHHVQSLDPFNVMMNFWWDEHLSIGGSPFEALIHSIMTIHGLPKDRKEVWETVFEHLVFDPSGQATEHLPKDMLGILGEMTPENAANIRNWLSRSLKQ